MKPAEFLFGLLLLGALTASIIVNLTRPSFSKKEFETLSKLASNASVNESGFVSARGFTDDFGRVEASNNQQPFVVTNGKISSAILATEGVITTTPQGSISLTPPDKGTGQQFLQSDGNGGVFWGAGVDNSIVLGQLGVKVSRFGDVMTGTLQMDTPIESSNPFTGCIIANGGIGVGGRINCRTSITAGGEVTAQGSTFGSIVRLAGSLTELRKTNPDNLGDNRVNWTNSTNPPTWGLLGPSVPSLLRSAASVRFGVSYLALSSASLDYVFNGTNQDGELAGGNLNAINISHIGQASQLSMFADGRSVFPRGDLAAARQSWFEARWASQRLSSLNETRDTSNVTGAFTVPVSGVNLYTGQATAVGLNSTTPVTTNGADPRFEFNGLKTIEWVQTTTPAIAPLTNPTGKRVNWTYQGLRARRFQVSIQGTYKSTDIVIASPRNLFQCLMKLNASGVNKFVDGTATAWSESATQLNFAEQLFSVHSKRSLLVNPGDVFEVAVGFHPNTAMPATNAVLVCPELSISFISMLNNS